ncbi:MAG TPA: DNA methyltransferase [Anaerolineales bacterium]|nr:DNA methyltransferase [Anaerolineales bacterium]
MSKRTFRNKLNDLEPKTWLKFQKSWFVHNPPPRRKNVLRHPAKFPETLAQEFIEFFTKRGQVVLDPMAGTGSTLVAALRAGRHSFGVELNPHYAAIAAQVVAEEQALLVEAATLTDNSPQSPENPAAESFTPLENQSQPPDTSDEPELPPSMQEPAIEFAQLRAQIIQGDAAHLAEYMRQYHIPPIDYVLTSPPYWDMLRARGAETQRKRRQDSKVDVYYSDDPLDLGNIENYEEFLEKLTGIYAGLKPCLQPAAYLTIIVKNVKKGGRIYPLAWDLARNLSRVYILKDERIWCQDDIRLAPYGLGNAWVSNTFHHYCLQFRNQG